MLLLGGLAQDEHAGGQHGAAQPAAALVQVPHHKLHHLLPLGRILRHDTSSTAHGRVKHASGGR